MILSDSPTAARNLNSSLAFLLTSGCPIRAGGGESFRRRDIAYSCQLDPLVAGDTRRLGAGFSNQRELYPAPDDVIIGSSILILSVILLVFLSPVIF